MTTKIIPAQTIKSCDECGTVMNKTTAIRDASLQLAKNTLDLNNQPVGRNTQSFDLCDTCFSKLITTIQALGGGLINASIT